MLNVIVGVGLGLAFANVIACRNSTGPLSFVFDNQPHSRASRV